MIMESRSWPPSSGDPSALNADSIERGLGSPQREQRVATSRQLLCMGAAESYGPLCEVLAAENWQARVNAAFLLGRLPPPSNAWRKEALGRLGYRIARETHSDVLGVMERAVAALRAQAPAPSPRQDARPRARSEKPKSRSKVRGRSSSVGPSPSHFEQPARRYSVDADGTIIWL
jgi:hypothetical protein